MAVSRIEDRIVLTRLHRLLGPLIERRLSPRCFAYRPGRGPLDAIRRVDSCLRIGLSATAAADIDDFFDNIDRARLLARVRETVWEPPVLDLLETYLHIGVEQAAEWRDTGRGIAQGSPLSPLLSNLYLAPFDRFLDGIGIEGVRYADNLLLLAREPAEAGEALAAATDRLEREHGLAFNADSLVRASEADGFEFLGYRFRRGRRTIAPAGLERKLAEIDRRFANAKGSPKRRLLEAAETLKGWRNYYGWGDTREQLEQLEKRLEDKLVEWLRRYRESSEKAVKARELRGWLGDAAAEAGLSREEAGAWAARLLTRSRPPKAPQAAGPSSAAAQRAVALRRRQLDGRRAEAEDLLITKPGTFVGRRESECWCARRAGRRWRPR